MKNPKKPVNSKQPRLRKNCQAYHITTRITSEYGWAPERIIESHLVKVLAIVDDYAMVQIPPNRPYVCPVSELKYIS